MWHKSHMLDEQSSIPCLASKSFDKRGSVFERSRTHETTLCPCLETPLPPLDPHKASKKKDASLFPSSITSITKRAISRVPVVQDALVYHVFITPQNSMCFLMCIWSYGNTAYWFCIKHRFEVRLHQFRIVFAFFSSPA